MVEIIKGDITALELDCIVNAANNTLLGGGGVDGTIHRVAGIELYKECKELGGCETGQAKITNGYNLPSKHVIHTVGPIYSHFRHERCCQLLSQCYENSLDLALKNNINSIAFPSISTGVYGFPIEYACKIALKTINDWQNNHKSYTIKILICCYSDETFEMYQKEANL